jgi:hypothetical protein
MFVAKLRMSYRSLGGIFTTLLHETKFKDEILTGVLRLPRCVETSTLPSSSSIINLWGSWQSLSWSST